MNRVVPIFLLTVATVMSPHLCGQAVAVAEVDGRILDPAGAVVPGAQIKITQTQTDLVRVVTADSLGAYALSNLPVGPYVLEVSAPGFKTYVQRGIILQVNNNVQVNVTLEVGSISENVTVTAATNMVETKENTVSQVIEERRITELPLNGRQPTQLILISGAATATPAGNLTGSKNYPTSTTMSVAGGQGNATNYLLDGGQNVDTYTNVNLPFPFPDALQEFSVETSSLPARNGLHPGGVVNIVTKSGTNQWHGDLFEFVRNGDVNARNFFAPTHDTLKRNQYGGTVGSKIIPDKLFFFFGYQGTRNRQDPPSTVSFVPTAAALSGDWSTIESAACQSNGKAKTLKDPLTSQLFPNNQIPVSRYDPAAIKLAGYLPSTSDPCGRVTYGIPTTGDEDQLIGKIDFIRSNKHSVFGRYFVSDYRNPAVFNPHNILVTTRPGNLERGQGITLGDTYAFGPNTVNSLHATFTRLANNRGPAPDAISARNLGVNVFVFAPTDLRMEVSGAFNVGCGTCSPAYFNGNVYQFADDVDIIRGKHQLAFGVDVLRIQNNILTGSVQDGDFQFSGAATGDAKLDLMLGTMSLFSQSLTQQQGIRHTAFGLYAQDTYRATNHLTVNVGLRWEPLLYPQDVRARGSDFSLSAFLAGQHSKVYPNAPAGTFFYGDPGYPRALTNDRLAVFSPRLGLVWNPHGDGRDTIRAGAGILYDSTQESFNQRMSQNPPFGTEVDQTAPNAPFSNPWAAYAGGNPYPNITAFPIGAAYVTLPLHIQPTSMTQWNFSYQRQIAANWKVSATYIGSKTTHLWLTDDLNYSLYIPGTCGSSPCSTSANSNLRRLLYLQNPSQGQYYSSVFTADDGANASYNGLLVSAEHRFARGFTLLTNYTWSHCISDGDFDGNFGRQSKYQNQTNRSADRGDCNYDYRHMFNASLVAISPVHGTSWTGRVFGDWQVAPLIRATSGPPVNVLTGTDNSLSGETIVLSDRPNVNPGISAYNASIGPALQWLNPAALSANPLGTFGNLGRDVLRAPGTLNFDVGFSRIFAIHEQVKLEVRAESFNIINHTNLNAPNVTLSSASFGRITSAADPRIMQFAMKLRF
jgi:hypothetical protein